MFHCKICSLSKNTQLPYNHSRPRAKRFLENVHTDLSGIMRVKGMSNELYYILFCDDYSSYRHIFPLRSKTKEEVHEIFRTYIAVAERQTGAKVIQFTLDRGGEFVNDLLGADLRSLGITLHLTAGHTPQQNGVAERGNRTVTTKARSMMLEASLPLHFWYLACSTAVFLINRSITVAIPNQKTPFKVWFFRKLSISHLKVFGCKSFRLLRKEIRASKFHPVSADGVLVGYDQGNFNYQIYDLNTRKICTSHDVTFFENEFPLEKTLTKTIEQSEVNSQQHNVKVLFSEDSNDDGEETEEPRVTPKAPKDPDHSPSTSTKPVESASEVTPPSDDRVEADENHINLHSHNPQEPDELELPPRKSSRTKGKQISY